MARVLPPNITSAALSPQNAAAAAVLVTLAVNVQQMQRAPFVHPGVHGIGVLQSFAAERNFLNADLGQPLPPHAGKISVTQALTH